MEHDLGGVGMWTYRRLSAILALEMPRQFDCARGPIVEGSRFLRGSTCVSKPLAEHRRLRATGHATGHIADVGILIPLARLLSVLVLAGNLVGCSTEACAGKAACVNQGTSRCTALEGCFPASPACIATPSNNTNCTGQSFEGGCKNAGSCSWSSGTCVNGCTLSGDQTSCQAASSTYGGCIWTDCSGAPTKQCAQYPVDTCPVAPLGCFIESRSWLGD